MSTESITTPEALPLHVCGWLGMESRHLARLAERLSQVARGPGLEGDYMARRALLKAAGDLDAVKELLQRTADLGLPDDAERRDAREYLKYIA